ncbi:MAG: hypothetical protein PIR02_13330 [Microbacterium enclense]
MATVIALAVTLSGCTTPQEPAQQPTQEETPVADMTWQDAKAATQATETEIAGRIPADEVASVAQLPEGTLISCGDGGHSWNGSTTVTLRDGVDADEVVRALEPQFAGGEYDVRTRSNIAGKYEVQLVAPDRTENYIIAEDVTPGTVRISSASPCFTLPDGVYPGGTF